MEEWCFLLLQIVNILILNKYSWKSAFSSAPASKKIKKSKQNQHPYLPQKPIGYV